jgi:hypothetical protein
MGSGRVRAPDILPAHLGVIGKYQAFLTPGRADGIYSQEQPALAGKNRIDLQRWPR